MKAHACMNPQYSIEGKAVVSMDAQVMIGDVIASAEITTVLEDGSRTSQTVPVITPVAEIKEMLECGTRPASTGYRYEPRQ